MTNDDIDVDHVEVHDSDMPADKPPLREIWENSPLLKLAAIALVGALAAGAYVIFVSKGDESVKSVMRIGPSTAKQIPGQKELDPIYRKALEEENKKTAEKAAQSGGSALPTPIGTAKMGGLDLPTMAEKPKSDPLVEWRKATEARSITDDTNPQLTPTECPEDAQPTDAAKVESERVLASDSGRRAAANGTTVDEALAGMADESAIAKGLLEEARNSAATNGTMVEGELAKMLAVARLIRDDKRRDTVRQELGRVAAGFPLLEEVKHRAVAGNTTLEESLNKMLAMAKCGGTKRKLLDEADNAIVPLEQAPMLPPARPQLQPAVKGKQGIMPQALADQMRLIVAAQAPTASRQTTITPEPSAYTEMKKQASKAESTSKNSQGGAVAAGAGGAGGAGASGSGAVGGGDSVQTIIPAGSIAYIQLLNELNSDVQGPVLAQILSGPFAGGRAIGQMAPRQGFSEYMVLTFTRIVKDAVTYSVNGIAMDENTTLTGVVSDVDHHYFDRIILPAAAKFISGYSSAASTTATTTTQTAGGGQATSQALPSPKQDIYKGIDSATKDVSNLLAQNQGRPVTIIVAKGTTMGLLFVDSVTTGNAGK
ncbi:MAG: DotG/IcmE/VirB10 family protein [Proteobacteria bacterium]|nr:DotG/IcmE/VirB10 family protein [Pseudomonadota bacterium]